MDHNKEDNPDLSEGEVILLAAEYVAKGLSIPMWIKNSLRDTDLSDLEGMRQNVKAERNTHIVGKSRLSA